VASTNWRQIFGIVWNAWKSAFSIHSSGNKSFWAICIRWSSIM